VYDYVPGKEDWLARNLPIEGRNADAPTAGSVARRDAPTCSEDETLGDLRARIGSLSVCVVVNRGGVVAGLLRAEQLDGSDETLVGDAMQPGPSTYRPHVPIAEMAQVMREHDLDNVPVTTSEGVLVGVLFRDDAVRKAHEQHDD
jgi:Mg/Co/Ni transporter MgtE